MERTVRTRSQCRTSQLLDNSGRIISGWANANASTYFNIPIQVDGGTGPNQGRFGTLGRRTFRGPAHYDFDFSLIKDTPVGRRSSVVELMDLQFRGEFFNLFNIVNMGLPANTLTGSGFGKISKTARTSRQIQLSSNSSTDPRMRRSPNHDSSKANTFKSQLV